MIDIEKAKSEVNELFNSLYPIADEIVQKYSIRIDSIVKNIEKAQFLTNDEIRDMMLSLSVEAYNFSMAKDSSLLRQECATTLLKESQAKEYNNAEGTQLIRNNYSIINTADSQVVSMLYSSVANLMKTKLDETHRMISTLNSILISRNAEAKLTNNNQSERQILNE